MRQPPEQIPPLLYGPDDVTEGYYELEATERSYTLHALRQHRAEVALWYRALTLYHRGMLGTWEYPGDERGISQDVWGLRMMLLGLGASSAKASLDMLLAGYYSVAYASIRHMLETFVQCLYVEVAPSQALRWYRQPGRPTAKSKSPGCQEMVDAIKAYPGLAQTAQFMDLVKSSWNLMSKGSHPTGEGIFQTTSSDDGRFDFGATYHRHMALDGFTNGLFALELLVQAQLWFRQQDDPWQAMLVAWRQDVGTWRQAVAAELNNADEDAGWDKDE